MDNNDGCLKPEKNLLEIFLVIASHKKFIIIFSFVTAVAAVILSLLMPNIYSATSRVLPPQKEQGAGLSALLGQMGGMAGLAAGSLGGGSDLYVGILKSRSVSDAVIKRLQLTKVYGVESVDDARNILDKAVRAQAGKDGIINISVENKDPKMAAMIANTVVDELGRVSVRLNLSKVGGERTFLEKRLAVVVEDLRKAEEDLKEFSKKHQVVQVDAQAKASIEGVARLKAEIASKEVELAALRSYQTDTSLEVKALRNSIGRLKAQLGSLASASGGGSGLPSIGSVPGIGLEYARKMRELKTQEAVFEQLTKQHELAKLSEAKDTSSLQVLDEAVVPLKKIKPRRSLIVIVSTFVGFILSVAIAFLRDSLQNLSDEERNLFHLIKRQATNFTSRNEI